MKIICSYEMTLTIYKTSHVSFYFWNVEHHDESMQYVLQTTHLGINSEWCVFNSIQIPT